MTALDPTPTHTPPPTTPPTPPLDQLKKAAIVATFANIDLEEVSMHVVLFTSTIVTARGPVH